MSASDLLAIQVEIFNSQKLARMLCVGDYIVYDNRVVRVKDVVFMGKTHVEIEAQIISTSSWVDIQWSAFRDEVFTLVMPRIGNPSLRG